MKLYWYGFIHGFDVTYHLKSDHVSRWKAIRGVQIGPWFIGAIKGQITATRPAPVPSTEEP